MGADLDLEVGFVQVVQEIIGSFFATILARTPADFDAIREDLTTSLPLVELPKPYKEFVSAADTPLEFLARDLTPGPHTAAPVGWFAAGLAALRAPLHAPAGCQPREPEREPRVRARFGDRRAQGVRGVLADACRAVPRRGKHGAAAVSSEASSAGWAPPSCSSGIKSLRLIPYAELHLDVLIFLAGFAATVVFALL